MAAALDLVKLIQKEVLPEIEDAMDELFEIVASKKETQEDKDELKETQELQAYFKGVLEELEAGEMEEEECLEFIEEINAMRTMDV